MDQAIILTDNTLLLWHYTVAQGLLTLLLVHGLLSADAGMRQFGAPAPAPASTPAPAPPSTWRLWVAPIVWALHLLAIYGVTALLCERQGSAGWFGADAVPWFVAAATLVAALVLLATLAVAVRDLRRAATLPEPATFVHWLGAAVAGLALLAVLWETLPVLMLAGLAGCS